MAELRFNPPEWLIEEYMRRKQPAEIANEGIGNAINTYAAARQSQDAKKQAALANYLKLVEADPQLVNTPMGQQLQQEIGGGLGGYQPPSVSTSTAPSQPMAPGSGMGSPIIAAWSQQNAQPQTQGAPQGAPQIPDISALQGRGKMGEKVIGQFKTGQEMQKTGLEMQKLQRDLNTDPNAPVPTMTKAKALAAGEINPNTKILEPEKAPQSGAQKAVDREFAREYTRYVAAGGYADVVGQIQSLEGVLTDLEGGKKNLTGPVISAQPDWARKRLNPKSMSAQQAVEQSVQRTLKQTLGGQFTEKEGMLFMQRGYDPALPEKENAKKLRGTLGQLKTMALAKQQAMDYYEENGTLDGYKGDLYTIKGGEMVRTKKEDFYRMMGADTGSSVGGDSGLPQVGGTFQGGTVKSIKRVR